MQNLGVYKINPVKTRVGKALNPRGEDCRTLDRHLVLTDRDASLFVNPVV